MGHPCNCFVTASGTPLVFLVCFNWERGRHFHLPLIVLDRKGWPKIRLRCSSLSRILEWAALDPKCCFGQLMTLANAWSQTETSANRKVTPMGLTVRGLGCTILDQISIGLVDFCRIDAHTASDCPIMYSYRELHMLICFSPILAPPY